MIMITNDNHCIEKNMGRYGHICVSPTTYTQTHTHIKIIELVVTVVITVLTKKMAKNAQKLFYFCLKYGHAVIVPSIQSPDSC